MGAATILMFDVAPCRELSCGGSGRRSKTADSFATYVPGKPDAGNPPVRFDEGREPADPPRAAPAYSTPLRLGPQPLPPFVNSSHMTPSAWPPAIPGSIR